MNSEITYIRSEKNPHQYMHIDECKCTKAHSIALFENKAKCKGCGKNLDVWLSDSPEKYSKEELEEIRSKNSDDNSIQQSKKKLNKNKR